MQALAIFDVAALTDVAGGLEYQAFQEHLPAFKAWLAGRVGFTNRAGLVTGSAGRQHDLQSQRGAAGMLSAVLAPLGIVARLGQQRVALRGLEKLWALRPAEGQGVHDFRPPLWAERPSDFAFLDDA